MRQPALGVLALGLLFAGFGLSMVEDTNWAQLDEDMMVMERLVRDTLREAIIDPEVKALEEEQARLEALSAESDISGTEFRSFAEVQKRLEEVTAKLRETKDRLSFMRRMMADAQNQWAFYGADDSAFLWANPPPIEMDAGATGIASDALYLPGYGVVFAVKVGFALSDGREPSPTPEPAREGRWEETRREVLGLPVLPEQPVAVSPAYDEDLVERVKDALVDVLAVEAPNFRQLADNERLVVFLHSPVKETGATRRGARVRRSSSVGPVEPSPPTVPADELEYQIVKQVADIEAKVFADSFAESFLASRRSRLLYSGAEGARTGLMVSVKASDLAVRRDGKITEEELEERMEVEQF